MISHVFVEEGVQVDLWHGLRVVLSPQDLQQERLSDTILTDLEAHQTPQQAVGHKTVYFL